MKEDDHLTVFEISPGTEIVTLDHAMAVAMTVEILVEIHDATTTTVAVMTTVTVEVGIILNVRTHSETKINDATEKTVISRTVQTGNHTTGVKTTPRIERKLTKSLKET